MPYTLNIKHRILEPKTDGNSFTITLDNTDMEYINSTNMVEVEVKNAVVSYDKPHTLNQGYTLTNFPEQTATNAGYEDPNTALGNAKTIPAHTITTQKFTAINRKVTPFDKRLHTPVLIASNTLAPNKIKRSNCKTNFIIQKEKTCTHNHGDGYAAELANAIVLNRPLYTIQSARVELNHLDTAYQKLIEDQSDAAKHAKLDALNTFLKTYLPYDEKVSKSHPDGHLILPVKISDTATNVTYSQNTASVNLDLDIQLKEMLWKKDEFGNIYYFSELYVSDGTSSGLRYVGKIKLDNWDPSAVFQTAGLKGALIGNPTTPDWGVDGNNVTVAFDTQFASADGASNSATACGFLQKPCFDDATAIPKNAVFVVSYKQMEAGAKKEFKAESDDISGIEALRTTISNLENGLKISELSVSHDTHDVIATVNAPLESYYDDRLCYQQSQTQKFECSPPRWSQIEFSVRPMYVPLDLWKQNEIGSVEVSFDLCFY